MGLRPAEISRITLDDISFQQGELTLRERKGGDVITLPLPENTIKAIALYVSQGRPQGPSRHLFLNHPFPYRPVDSNTVVGYIARAMKQAGLPSSSYWLRHTYAQNLLLMGQSIYEVKEMLGHQNIQSTHRYLHIDTKLMRKVTDLLKKRASGLDPPIQMCDALSRNVPQGFRIVLANCLVHARRNFIDAMAGFPDKCQHVLEALGKVYHHDAITKEQRMTPLDRLSFHQDQSGPIMKGLKVWLQEQLEKKEVEPNSPMGKAITYMLKHWEPLTLFLRVPGAPLDNNVCEQALKKALLHRKNSYFFRTEHGAYVGDLFMSLIHTCKLNGVNPFHYLTTIQKHKSRLFKKPQNYMPWNYLLATHPQAI